MDQLRQLARPLGGRFDLEDHHAHGGGFDPIDGVVEGRDQPFYIFAVERNDQRVHQKVHDLVHDKVSAML